MDESCTRCGGPLKARKELADLVAKIRDEAPAAVAEYESDAAPTERVQAELDYVYVAIDQVVSELKGVCSDCWEPEDG
jgi:hypothetical protein